MKIVSTTIAGPGSEATIGKAIASVAPLVDGCIVLVNAPTDAERKAIGVAAVDALDDAPDGRVFIAFGEFEWQNDFSDARNRALEKATLAGADWCLWIDTDEWFEYPAAYAGDLRQVLATTDRGALLMQHASHSYSQPRLIRLPTTERWVGKTHECFAAYKVGQGTIDGITFNDAPKTAEQLAHKFARDRDILAAEVVADPHNSRSWFYLGESQKNLGRFAVAANAYEQCAKLRGWNEESAWACYRAAECYIELGHLPSAIDTCAQGLALHAGVPELAWLAGWCNQKLGRHEQAIHWSLMAAAGGEYESGPRTPGSRIGFRHPPALWEGPFDVMRHSYKALGLARGQNIAEIKFQAARQMRLAQGSNLQRRAVTHGEQAAAAEAVGFPHLADALRQAPERP
jgi:tetratricopeptide (TPR) repeat protein